MPEDLPDYDDEIDSPDYDTQDAREVQQAQDLRVLLTGYPARPGTIR